MVNRDPFGADTRCMRRRPSAEHRDRLVNRISAMGQVSALVAMASTGVTAGVLAHDAKAKDLAAAQARQQAAPAPAPAPVQVRLVPRPVRTVLVRVAAPAARRTATRTTPVRRTAAAPRVVRVAPKRVSQPAPKPVARPASQPASQPAATTSTGS
jgi:hypothetical protein